MGFALKYINVFDDINASNLDDIQKFYNQADIRIEKSFDTPSFDDGQTIQNDIQKLGVLTASSVASHLRTYAMLEANVAEEISHNILRELRILVPSDSAVKSAYTKVVYWLRKIFSTVLNNNINNIFVNISPNKYEIYTLYIASKLGNNIVIIDNAFTKEKYSIYNNINALISGTSERLELKSGISIDLDSIISMITYKNSDDNNSSKQIGRGMQAIIVGEDAEGKLNTTLVNIANNLPDRVELLKTGINKLSFEEVDSVHRPSVQNVGQLIRMIGVHMIPKKPETNSVIEMKAVEFMKGELDTESNVQKAITKLITFICLYKRYNISKEVLVCYGKIDSSVEVYTSFLKYIGKVVIVVDTLGESKAKINKNKWEELRLSEPVEYHEYPNIAVSNTMAFNASREMDEVLYNGETLGLYRDRQYETCEIAVLNTTFDEMLMIWKEDNTVKPSFTSTKSKVTVPVFYTQIMGVCSEYENKLGQLITDHTILCYRVTELLQDRTYGMQINHYANVNGTSFKEQIPFYKNGRVEIEKLMGHRTFSYKHLGASVQKHILGKLDLMIREKWIACEGLTEEKLIDTILNVGLNLSKRIQQEMQWYDFTKQSPKLLMLCQNEDMISLEDSVLLTLLHLCGWDIVLAIPTCYNILGNNLRYAEIQQHIIGEPKFDINITQLAIVEASGDRSKKRGLLGRLFG